MARIKITDLPEGMTVGKDELKRVKGGLGSTKLAIFVKYDSPILKGEVITPINPAIKW